MGAGHNNQVGVHDNKRGSEEQKTMIVIIGDQEGVTWSSSSSSSLCSGSSLPSSDPSSEEDSSFSNGSSSSSELLDDDASSSPSSSLTTPRSRRGGGGSGGLKDLASLAAHLPIKKGLSQFYDGKSQSFSSLEIVESIGDLAKKGNPCNNRKLKYCKSYAAGLNNYYKPKATISKRSSSSLSFLSRRPSFNSCRPPPCPFDSQVETNF